VQYNNSYTLDILVTYFKIRLFVDVRVCDSSADDSGAYNESTRYSTATCYSHVLDLLLYYCIVLTARPTVSSAEAILWAFTRPCLH